MTEQISNIIGNYGALGLVFYLFVKEFFGYLNKNKGDTKKDEKQDIGLAIINERVKNIELQVSNHLPTAIKELSADFKKHCEKQEAFERELLSKLK